MWHRRGVVKPIRRVQTRGMRLVNFVCVLGLLAACGDDDSSTMDSGMIDAMTSDTGTIDTGTSDTGTADTGTGMLTLAGTWEACSEGSDPAAACATTAGTYITFTDDGTLIWWDTEECVTTSVSVTGNEISNTSCDAAFGEWYTLDVEYEITDTYLLFRYADFEDPEIYVRDSDSTTPPCTADAFDNTCGAGAAAPTVTPGAVAGAVGFWQACEGEGTAAEACAESVLEQYLTIAADGSVTLNEEEACEQYLVEVTEEQYTELSCFGARSISQYMLELNDTHMSLVFDFGDGDEFRAAYQKVDAVPDCATTDDLICT